MRKHNKAMAARAGGRDKGDRSNFSQHWGNHMANAKEFQLASNGLLRALLSRVIPKDAPKLPVKGGGSWLDRAKGKMRSIFNTIKGAA